MPFIAHRVWGWEPVKITPEWGMRDLPNGYAYPLCNSVQCTACNALFLDIRFDEEEVSRLYTGYRGAEYASQRERFEPGYSVQNEVLNAGYNYIPVVEEMLSPYLPSSIRVLDWGGDTGVNTPFRHTAAIHHVYDISHKELVKSAVHIEQPIASGYDLVVLSNVLEHLPYPQKELLRVSRVMDKNTLLYIEVPYEAVVKNAVIPTPLHQCKKYWHEHINFFVPSSLQALVASCSLELLELKSFDAAVGKKTVSQLAAICRKSSTV